MKTFTFLIKRYSFQSFDKSLQERQIENKGICKVTTLGVIPSGRSRSEGNRLRRYWTWRLEWFRSIASKRGTTRKVS